MEVAVSESELNPELCTIIWFPLTRIYRIAWSLHNQCYVRYSWGNSQLLVGDVGGNNATDLSRAF